MPPELQAQIDDLHRMIASQEKLIQVLRTNISEMERDIEEFRKEYDRVVAPIEKMVEGVDKAIAALKDLLRSKAWGQNVDPDSIWRDKQPESPPARDESPAPEPRRRNREGDLTERIKALYRDLARRFHPDLAQTEQERAERTHMMTLVNQAYHERDIDMLEALNADRAEQRAFSSDLFNDAVPYMALKIERLKLRRAELDQQIRELKITRAELRDSYMLNLRADTMHARYRGQDLLQEMADNMQQEYWEKMKVLDQLREQAANW